MLTAKHVKSSHQEGVERTEREGSCNSLSSTFLEITSVVATVLVPEDLNAVSCQIQISGPTLKFPHLNHHDRIWSLPNFRR